MWPQQDCFQHGVECITWQRCRHGRIVGTSCPDRPQQHTPRRPPAAQQTHCSSQAHAARTRLLTCAGAGCQGLREPGRGVLAQGPHEDGRQGCQQPRHLGAEVPAHQGEGGRGGGTDGRTPRHLAPRHCWLPSASPRQRPCRAHLPAVPARLSHHTCKAHTPATPVCLPPLGGWVLISAALCAPLGRAAPKP